MHDIKRRDRKVFLKELVTLRRILVIMVVAALVSLAAQGQADPGGLLACAAALVGAVVYSAHVASVPKRFYSPKFLYLWEAVQERHVRLKRALRQLSRRGIADLAELPVTIEAVVRELYVALRRADMIENEITNSEGWLLVQPPVPGIVTHDRQAQELYRIADKNIAEYRQRFQAVMAGVERTEAQAAVMTTTLDTLRIKMLGYRLVGRDPEAPTQDFLEAITEARMQLDSIDKALSELELSPFPKTVTVLPDGGGAARPAAPPHPVSGSPLEPCHDEEDRLPGQNQ
jgi:hypothetical protein